MDAISDFNPVSRSKLHGLCHEKLTRHKTFRVAALFLMFACLLYGAESICYEFAAVSITEQAEIAVEDILLNIGFDVDDAPLKASWNQGGSYKELSDVHKDAYEKMYKAVWLQRVSVRINGISDDELFDIYTQMKADHPELIHIGDSPSSHSVTVNTRVSHTVVTLSFDYRMNKSQTKENRVSLASRISDLIQGVAAIKDESSKAESIHDKLCKLVEYDYSALEEDSKGHSAFDSICNGLAVCEGYAHGYTLLCRSAGLECETIVGNLESSKDPTIGHAWNRVRIDGEWLYVDTTFDDGRTVSDDLLLRPISFMEEKGYAPFDNNIVPGITERA